MSDPVNPDQEPTWFTEQHDYTGSSIGFRAAAARRYPFQSIEIYDSTDWGKLMVIDGCMMVTTRDNREMMSHPALYTHPRAKRRHHRRRRPRHAA